MRKMILTGAMVLVSATAALADGTRSLSLPSSDTASASAPRPTYVRQAGEVTVTPAPVPAVAAPVQPTQPVAPAVPSAAASTTPAATAAPQPAATEAAPSVPRTGSAQRPSRSSRSARSAKPRGKSWTEARIVRELHRHGIYW
ncbi:hypothetical protein ACQR16_27355 [Bradyrhizobium oligotrophicum]|uniref:hypothetical protein n=1 Tax=Bradyrhizobium oligotrophicum TaxID=44255 RepID=UPI003EC07AF2